MKKLLYKSKEYFLAVQIIFNKRNQELLKKFISGKIRSENVLNRVHNTK